MSGITTYVHAGVVVEDLATAVEFFTALGLECDPPMIVEGEWVDRVIDLDGTRIELVMTRAPDGSGEMELVKFHAPDGEADGEPSPAPVNRPGIRHLAYQVDDLRSVVDRVRAAGWGLCATSSTTTVST